MNPTSNNITRPCFLILIAIALSSCVPVHHGKAYLLYPKEKVVKGCGGSKYVLLSEDLLTRTAVGLLDKGFCSPFPYK